MSKSPTAKANYSARREIRLRRDKTAALIMAALLGSIESTILPHVEGLTLLRLAQLAANSTDILLAELDRTRPPEAIDDPA